MAALIDTMQVSGPGRQLAALARYLAPVGVEFLVVTFHRAGRSQSPYLEHLEQAGVRYVLMPESGPLDLRLIPRVRRVLAQWAPSVVQTHGYKPTALAYALRRSGASWPWIAFFHGTTSENAKTRLYHWLDRRMMARADRVVVMSRRQQASFSHLGAKVHVLYNAVISLGSRQETRALTNLSSSPFGAMSAPLIGVVGRFSPEKGVDVFLHACRELVRRRVAFSAVVAGDGPQRDALEKLRDTLGLTGHVHYPGIVASVEALYSRLDLLVIPSRSEGLPNVLLEALRADVPVVATRVGAVPEVIDSPLAGVLVPPNDPTALADAIERSLSVGDTAGARTARREVAERFSLERRGMEHLTLYADLLHRPDLPRSLPTPTTNSGMAWR